MPGAKPAVQSPPEFPGPSSPGGTGVGADGLVDGADGYGSGSAPAAADRPASELLQCDSRSKDDRTKPAAKHASPERSARDGRRPDGRRTAVTEASRSMLNDGSGCLGTTGDAMPGATDSESDDEGEVVEDAEEPTTNLSMRDEKVEVPSLSMPTTNDNVTLPQVKVKPINGAANSRAKTKAGGSLGFGFATGHQASALLRGPAPAQSTSAGSAKWTVVGSGLGAGARPAGVAKHASDTKKVGFASGFAGGGGGGGVW